MTLRVANIIGLTPLTSFSSWAQRYVSATFSACSSKGTAVSSLGREARGLFFRMATCDDGRADQHETRASEAFDDFTLALRVRPLACCILRPWTHLFLQGSILLPLPFELILKPEQLLVRQGHFVSAHKWIHGHQGGSDATGPSLNMVKAQMSSLLRPAVPPLIHEGTRNAQDSI